MVKSHSGPFPSGKIQSILFERTALSIKPEDLAKKELAALREEKVLTADLVFRNPHFLISWDYRIPSQKWIWRRRFSAKWNDSYSNPVPIFHSFPGRSRSALIHEDYYIDLLFYHRKLRRLVAIDLKLGKFRATDKGQMELYL